MYSCLSIIVYIKNHIKGNYLSNLFIVIFGIVLVSVTVVLGPIWTNLVSNKDVIFLLKIVSHGQIKPSRYKLWNLKTSCTS